MLSVIVLSVVMLSIV